MIIILEGPDGSGKTILARQLQERFNLGYRHEGPPPPGSDPLEYYGYKLEEVRNKDVVLDRFALGERVYGPILRDQDKFGKEGWKIFNRLITAVGAIEVLCLPPYATCLKEWASGREELIRQKDIFDRTYDKFYELRGNQIIYIWTQPDAFENLCHIIRHIEQDNHPLPNNVIGSQTADYLFVGDIGGNASSRHSLPFFAVSNSSSYLNRAIAAAKYQEKEIAFINARANNGHKQPIPNFRRMIALGKMAAEELTRQQRVFYEVPHPQYWKRFKHHEFQTYVQMLTNARLV